MLCQQHLLKGMDKFPVYYLRDGRRFVKATDLTGWFFNGKAFTKNRMNDSIGVCVLHTLSKVVICSLKKADNMWWSLAKTWCEKQFDGKGYMPSIEELCVASKYIFNIFKGDLYIWSSTERDKFNAWYLLLPKSSDFGRVYGNHKNLSNSVLAFCSFSLTEHE